MSAILSGSAGTALLALKLRPANQDSQVIQNAGITRNLLQSRNVAAAENLRAGAAFQLKQADTAKNLNAVVAEFDFAANTEEDELATAVQNITEALDVRGGGSPVGGGNSTAAAGNLTGNNFAALTAATTFEGQARDISGQTRFVGREVAERPQQTPIQIEAAAPQPRPVQTPVPAFEEAAPTDTSLDSGFTSNSYEARANGALLDRIV